jgi:hypothetical protein
VEEVSDCVILASSYSSLPAINNLHPHAGNPTVLPARRRERLYTYIINWMADLIQLALFHKEDNQQELLPRSIGNYSA